MLSVPEIFDRLRASYAIECADLYEQAIAQVSRQKMPTRGGILQAMLAASWANAAGRQFTGGDGNTRQARHVASVACAVDWWTRCWG